MTTAASARSSWAPGEAYGAASDGGLTAVSVAAGRDLRIGLKLPLHFAAAGVGEPDGTDVVGLLRPLAEAGGIFQAVYQSMRPAGLRLGLTTEAAGQAFAAEITEAIRERRGVGMSPLPVSAWKQKPLETGPTR
jgi:hypothetical protein